MSVFYIAQLDDLWDKRGVRRRCVLLGLKRWMSGVCIRESREAGEALMSLFLDGCCSCCVFLVFFSYLCLWLGTYVSTVAAATFLMMGGIFALSPVSRSRRGAIQPVNGNEIITHLAQLRGEIPSSQGTHLRSSEGKRMRTPRRGHMVHAELPVRARGAPVLHLTYQTPFLTLMVGL